MIGSQGLTPAVLKEIERSLAAHELIKVKAASDEAETRPPGWKRLCGNRRGLGAADWKDSGDIPAGRQAGDSAAGLSGIQRASPARQTRTGEALLDQVISAVRANDHRHIHWQDWSLQTHGGTAK